MLVLLVILRLTIHDVFDVGHDCLQLAQVLVHLHVLENGFAKMVAQLLQNTGVKMQVCVLAKIAAAEGSLERERVLQAELLPADDTARTFFRLLDAEGTVDEGEDLGLLFKQIRKDTLPKLRVIFVAVAVHEDVLLS